VVPEGLIRPAAVASPSRRPEGDTVQRPRSRKCAPNSNTIRRLLPANHQHGKEGEEERKRCQPESEDINRKGFPFALDLDL